MTTGVLFEQMAMRVSLEDRIAALESALESRDLKIRKLRHRVKDLEEKVDRSRQVNSQLAREMERMAAAKSKREHAVRSIYADSDSEDQQEFPAGELYAAPVCGRRPIIYDIKPKLADEEHQGCTDCMVKHMTEKVANDNKILAGILTSVGVDVDASRGRRSNSRVRDARYGSAGRGCRDPKVDTNDLGRAHEEFHRLYKEEQYAHKKRTRLRGSRYRSVEGSPLRGSSMDVHVHPHAQHYAQHHARLRRKSNSMHTPIGRMLFDAYNAAQQQDMERYRGGRW